MQGDDPWFVAMEVCPEMGFAHTASAVRRHCKYAKKLSSAESAHLTGQANPITIFPESDLYNLAMGSTLPQAQRFKAWVTEVVLPRIRKTCQGCHAGK